MHRILAVLVMVAVPLAGCVGGPAPDGAASDASNSSADDAAPGAGNATPSADGSVRTYATNGTSRTVVNGTYEPQEACNTGGCLTDDAFRTEDVTDMVPPGVPTVVSAEVTYDTGNEVTPEGMEAWISGSNVAYYRYDFSESTGVDRVNVTLVRTGDGTVVANLIAAWPNAAQDPNVDYTLTVEARALERTVPTGVPVEVQVDSGQEVVASTVDGGSVAFRVYGPDDAYQGQVAGDGQATFQPDSGGAYVLVPTPSSSNLTLSGGTEAPMRALILDATISEPTTYNGTGEETWTFERDGYPLVAGVYVTDVYGGTPLGFGPWAASNIEAGITPPNGSATTSTVLGCAAVCFAIGGFGSAVPSPIAAPGLVPGTYEGRVSSDAAVGFQYGHFTATYQR